MTLYDGLQNEYLYINKEADERDLTVDDRVSVCKHVVTNWDSVAALVSYISRFMFYSSGCLWSAVTLSRLMPIGGKIYGKLYTTWPTFLPDSSNIEEFAKLQVSTINSKGVKGQNHSICSTSFRLVLSCVQFVILLISPQPCQWISTATAKLSLW